MDKQEMVDILEALIRDPDTNATAKCTAIRTLREVQPLEDPAPSGFEELYAVEPRRRGGLSAVDPGGKEGA